jgi:hypothetical protein
MPLRTRPAPLPSSLPRAEHHPHASAPWDEPPLPLATGARTAHGNPGPCRVCGHAIMPGERIADLPGGALVHVAGCAAKGGVMPALAELLGRADR